MGGSRARVSTAPLHAMSPLPAGGPDGMNYFAWAAVYNATSFGIAAMGSACIFAWIQMPNVIKKYRTALAVNGLVTAIATYHYFRIFSSWVAAYNVEFNAKTDGYDVSLAGPPFNDAYRYVDWLLTVPLLLIELILVMGLPKEETTSMCWKLGFSSGLMVALGYPGEVQDGPGARFQWWAFAMIPFCYVVYSLAVGLEEATQRLPASVSSLVWYARWLTIISWCTYPCVYMVKMIGPPAGYVTTAAEQIGYSFADVMAKAVFGIMIWRIASEKSAIEEEGGLLKSGYGGYGS